MPVYLEASEIARVCYEANRAYCSELDPNDKRPPWEEANEWQRVSTTLGVENIIHGVVTSPQESHERWMEHLLADGWTPGPERDTQRKEHPCLVEWARLPPVQQRKDVLFFAIVQALALGRSP